MTKWQVVVWLAIGYALLVGAYLVCAWFFFRNEEKRNDADDDAMRLAEGARRRAVDDAARPPVGDVPPVRTRERRHLNGAARDETLGRDQYRAEARARTQSQQTLRQREALDRLKHGE